MNGKLEEIKQKLGLKAIDHIGIAVGEIKSAAETFGGFWPEEPEMVDFSERGMQMAVFGIPGVRLEFIEGAEGTAIEKFVSKRGGGLHHLAFRVTDLKSEMAKLADLGIRPLTEEPQPGIHDTQVLFLHPKDTGGILIELVQHNENPEKAEGV
jgi:methylmalonyl-CoA/ethylmalonyl-CoA epimerase